MGLGTPVVYTVNDEYQIFFSMQKDVIANTLNIPPEDNDRKIIT